jgi:hypothetical protein
VKITIVYKDVNYTKNTTKNKSKSGNDIIFNCDQSVEFDIKDTDSSADTIEFTVIGKTKAKGVMQVGQIISRNNSPVTVELKNVSNNKPVGKL